MLTPRTLLGRTVLAVDNAFATPVLQRPLALGADLVIHSGTKFLDGQGRVMAGALCGSRKLINEVFAPLIRAAGMVLSPFNAWVVQKGLETLAVRVRTQSANALQIAQWLEQQPAVEHRVRGHLDGAGQHTGDRPVPVFVGWAGGARWPVEEVDRETVVGLPVDQAAQGMPPDEGCRQSVEDPAVIRQGLTNP